MPVTPEPARPRPARLRLAFSGEPADQVEVLHRLPRAYRSWGSGITRVVAALLLTVAGGIVLRSMPESGSGVAAAAPSRPRASVASSSEASSLTARATGSPSLVGSAAPQLHVLMVSPAGTRTVPVDVPVHLHADVSDGQGGEAAAVDLVWQIRSAAGEVVFAGRGADVLLPSGLLAQGFYRVTVRAVDGPAAAADQGALRLVAGRS